MGEFLAAHRGGLGETPVSPLPIRPSRPALKTSSALAIRPYRSTLTPDKGGLLRGVQHRVRAQHRQLLTKAQVLETLHGPVEVRAINLNFPHPILTPRLMKKMNPDYLCGLSWPQVFHQFIKP